MELKIHPSTQLAGKLQVKIEKERIQGRKIQTTAYSGEWYCLEICPNVYFVSGLYWNEINLDIFYSSYNFMNGNTNLIRISLSFSPGIFPSVDFLPLEENCRMMGRNSVIT